MPNTTSFSSMLFDRFSIACYAVIPAVACAYCFTFLVADHNQMGVTMFDLFVTAYDPTSGLPLAWFACPLITMLVLTRIWNRRFSPVFAIHEKSRYTLFRACVIDITVVSLFSTCVLQLSLLLVGAFTIGNTFETNIISDSFAYVTGGQTIEDFSFPAALAIMLLYAFLAIGFANSLYFLLYSVCKPLLAYGIVSLLAYPEVHKPYSFIYDIVSTFGGSMTQKNPIFYLYGTASVYYPSWLPGESHSLWFLCALILGLLSLALLCIRRKDFLS